MNNNFYNPSLKYNARELRTATVSKAEKYIWKALLSRNKLGHKFKRQRPIDRFIVDFFCSDLQLIIEIDGNSHKTKVNMIITDNRNWSLSGLRLFDLAKERCCKI